MTAELTRILLTEYQKLKEEQSSRIGFRDNLLYATLAAIGATASFAATNPNILLILPFATFALGWTYLINDEKISAIGQYIQNHLGPQILELQNISNISLFHWEYIHKHDKRRTRRKTIQLIVDQIVFCLSGLGSIAAYLYLEPNISTVNILIMFIGGLTILLLSIELILYSSLLD